MSTTSSTTKTDNKKSFPLGAGTSFATRMPLQSNQPVSQKAPSNRLSSTKTAAIVQGKSLRVSARAAASRKRKAALKEKVKKSKLYQAPKLLFANYKKVTFSRRKFRLNRFLATLYDEYPYSSAIREVEPLLFKDRPSYARVNNVRAANKRKAVLFGSYLFRRLVKRKETKISTALVPLKNLHLAIARCDVTRAAPKYPSLPSERPLLFPKAVLLSRKTSFNQVAVLAKRFRGKAAQSTSVLTRGLVSSNRSLSSFFPHDLRVACRTFHSSPFFFAKKRSAETRPVVKKALTFTKVTLNKKRTLRALLRPAKISIQKTKSRRFVSKLKFAHFLINLLRRHFRRAKVLSSYGYRGYKLRRGLRKRFR